MQLRPSRITFMHDCEANYQNVDHIISDCPTRAFQRNKKYVLLPSPKAIQMDQKPRHRPVISYIYYFTLSQYDHMPTLFVVYLFIYYFIPTNFIFYHSISFYFMFYICTAVWTYYTIRINKIIFQKKTLSRLFSRNIYLKMYEQNEKLVFVFLKRSDS